MVDKPDPRRINKVPIPRGGGVALFLGLFGSFLVYVFATGSRWVGSGVGTHPVRVTALAGVIFLLGLADDKWSLPPKLKLLGQVVVASATWFWGGLGFSTLWPALPAAVDCVLTVFWIVGAVNAFNLIDGLDGLASGIALIATLGMAGSLLFVGKPDQTLFHFAFAGALIGFLRYNYNPASVFLGDSGSMLIGYLVATLPLATQTPNSFLVSVGVPMLAMGVPIFDTSLAILRRSIRHVILRREKREASAGDSDRVMSADHDHLHHRILRSTGLNQRKTAWILYLMTLVAVLFGLGGMMLKSRSAGLWLAAFAVGCVVVFRDMARVELFDAGRLLASFARDRATSARRRWAKLSVPFYVAFDAAALVTAFFVMLYVMQFPVTKIECRVALPIRVTASFAFLIFFRTYVTVWSRAMTSNFARMLVACAAGAVAGSIGLCCAPNVVPDDVAPAEIAGATLVYFLVSFLLIAAARVVPSDRLGTPGPSSCEGRLLRDRLFPPKGAQGRLARARVRRGSQVPRVQARARKDDERERPHDRGADGRRHPAARTVRGRYQGVRHASRGARDNQPAERGLGCGGLRGDGRVAQGREGDAGSDRRQGDPFQI